MEPKFTFEKKILKKKKMSDLPPAREVPPNNLAEVDIPDVEENVRF